MPTIDVHSVGDREVMASNVPLCRPITVRITKETAGGQPILRIEGRLRSELVPELEKECQSVDGPLVLELSQLLAADRTGIEAIRDLVAVARQH